MIHVRKSVPVATSLALALVLAACGNTTDEKAASGGLGGAAAGAVVGGPVGAVVGAGVGAAGGAYGDDAVEAMDDNKDGSSAQTASGDGMEQQSSMQSVDKAEIRDAQMTLQEMGLYRGQIDGLYGPNTRRAVSEFQSRQGLPRSGTLDRRTMQALDQQTARQIGD